MGDPHCRLSLEKKKRKNHHLCQKQRRSQTLPPRCPVHTRVQLPPRRKHRTTEDEDRSEHRSACREAEAPRSDTAPGRVSGTVCFTAVRAHGDCSPSSERTDALLFWHCLRLWLLSNKSCSVAHRKFIFKKRTIAGGWEKVKKERKIMLDRAGEQAKSNKPD